MNTGKSISGVVLFVLFFGLVDQSQRAEAGVIINGTNYVPTSTTESLVALFTDQLGTQSTNTYSGFVEILVSGTGASEGSNPNDAFYVFAGAPNNNNANYQLVVTKGADVINGSSGDDLAIKNIVFDQDTGLETSPSPLYIPAYRSDHTYKFVIDTTRLNGDSLSTLRFGVNDGSYSDNDGQYNVTVTQLSATTTVPEPTSMLIYALLGSLGLVAGFARRRGK